MNIDRIHEARDILQQWPGELYNQNYWLKSSATPLDSRHKVGDNMYRSNYGNHYTVINGRKIFGACLAGVIYLNRYDNDSMFTDMPKIEERIRNFSLKFFGCSTVNEALMANSLFSCFQRTEPKEQKHQVLMLLEDSNFLRELEKIKYAKKEKSRDFIDLSDVIHCAIIDSTNTQRFVERPYPACV